MSSLGRIWQRGQWWWIQYNHRGRQFRESSGSTNKQAARDLLVKRLGEIGTGNFAGPVADKTEFEELRAMLERDYAHNNRKSAKHVRGKTARLAAFFGSMVATEIDYDRMSQFAEARLGEGAAPATVQVELAMLSKMLTLAVRTRKLGSRPMVPTIKVENARQGFFEPDEISKVCDKLPAQYMPIVRFAYLTGWRKSEVLGLKWTNVTETQLTLDPGTTKNGEGRVFPRTPTLNALLSDLGKRGAMLSEGRETPIPWVFVHDSGKPIARVDVFFRRACEAAGLKGRIFHDLRRTAVRNMVRSGTSETVAMALSGHKTRKIFERYNIVSRTDLVEAAERLHKTL